MPEPAPALEMPSPDPVLRRRWPPLRLTRVRCLCRAAAEVSYGREVTDEDVAHFVKEGFLIKKNFYSLEEIELIHKVKVSALSALRLSTSGSPGPAASPLRADCR